MKPSAYTIPIELPNNGILLLYNTRSGALLEFPLPRKADIEAALTRPPVQPGVQPPATPTAPTAPPTTPPVADPPAAPSPAYTPPPGTKPPVAPPPIRPPVTPPRPIQRGGVNRLPDIDD